MKTREIYLDFIRGIAILLAMGWHFNNTTTGLWVVDVLLIPGRTLGWAGVDLFFVLSGFLIGGLIFNEYEQTGNFRAKRFLIRRAFKIWPVLYVYLLLLLVTGRYSWETFLLQNIFHVQNYFLTPLAHLWSLAVEEHFYLVFAIGILIFTKLRSKNIKIFAVVLPAILLTSLLLRFVAYAYLIDPQHIQIQTQFRIDALAFGMLLAYIKLFHEDTFEWVSRRKILLTIFFIIGVTALVFFQEDKYFKSTTGYTISYLTGGLLLLLCYRTKLVNKNNFVVNWIAWLGVYSYAMYVYQFVMMRVIEALFKKFQIPHASGGLDLFIKYAGAIILAVVLTKLIERPCLALREKIYPA